MFAGATTCLNDANGRSRPFDLRCFEFRTLTRQCMRIPRVPRACSALVSALFILLAGCSNPSSTSLNLLALKVTPATVSVGGAVTLQAIAHLSDGTTQDVTSSTQWALSNPSLAALGAGVLTAKAPGTLTVQAAYILVVPADQPSSAAS